MTTKASTERSAERELLLTRLFDAPPQLVFQAWTERDHLVRWSCPRGFALTRCEGDLRVGGAWRSCMRSPDGRDLWLGGVYREIIAPSRLVFTHAWDDADGNRGHETVVTVTFEEHAGKTKLTFHQAFFSSAESRDAHRGGWSECLDKLAEHLAAALPAGTTSHGSEG